MSAENNRYADRIVEILEQRLAAEDVHEVLLARSTGIPRAPDATSDAHVLHPPARVWREVMSRARTAGWDATFDGETLRVRFPA